MKLHGETVFDGHPAISVSIWALEDLLLFGDGSAGADAAVECGGCRRWRDRRSARWDGHGRLRWQPMDLKKARRLRSAPEIALPGADVLAGDARRACRCSGEARVLRIDDGVGTEGRDDAALPSGVANGLMVGERVQRRVGCGEHFDVEPLEERAGAELGRLRACRRSCRSSGRRFPREPLLEAEHSLEGVVEPEARGRAAKEVVVLGEDPPDFAWVGVFAGRRAGGMPRASRRLPGYRACGRRSGRAA